MEKHADNRTEVERWVSFMNLLMDRVSKDKARSQLFRLAMAVNKYPPVRLPRVEVHKDGMMAFAWSFSDIPDTVMTAEIHPDGGFDWFLKDKAEGVRGTEEALPHIPPEFVQYLERFFMKKDTSS